MKAPMALLLLLIPFLVFGFGTGTTKKIDVIENNTGTNIVLTPDANVVISTLTGEKALESGVAGELIESLTTNVELGFLSGVTSAVQTQLDLKANDLDVVKLVGDQSISGIKTFTGQFVAVSTLNGNSPCPSMTEAERDLIALPAEGDCVVNSTENELNFYLSGAWGKVGGGTNLLVKGNFIGFDGLITKECDYGGLDGDFLKRDAAADCGLSAGPLPDGTLQGSYDVSTQPQIIVDAVNLGLQVRDALVPIADKLLEVLSFDGLTEYFSVDAVWGYLFGEQIITVPVGSNDGEYIVIDSTVTPQGFTTSSSIQGKFNAFTNDVSFVPNYNGLIGTLGSANWHQEGEYLYASGTITVTTSGATTAKIEIPSGYQIDSSYVNKTNVGNLLAYNINSRYTNFKLITQASDSTHVYLTPVNNQDFVSGTTHLWNAIIGPYEMSWNIKVKIQGWSTGLDGIAENKKPISVSGIGNTGQFITSDVTPIPFTETKDTHSAYDGSVFTSPIKARFNVRGGTYYNSNASRNFYAYVDRGSGYVRETYLSTTVSAVTSIFKFFGVIELDIGDKFHIRDASTGGTLSDDDKFHNFYLDEIIEDTVIATTLQGINSSDLIFVSAAGNPGGAIGIATDIPFTEVKDVQGAWNGSVFTVIKKGQYTANIGVNTNATGQFQVDSFINGVKSKRVLQNDTGNSGFGFGTVIEDLEIGDTLSFRFSVAKTMLASTERHYLSITQSADHEAIIANLSLVADRCQTKFLGANTSSTGAIPDLTFSNINIGKKYRVRFHDYSENNALTNIQNGSTVLARSYIVGGTRILSIVTNAFNATDTSVTINKTNPVLTTGDGSGASTWAELCELGNTVSTTEF